MYSRESVDFGQSYECQAVRTTAHAYVAAGISVVPIRLDGSKSPLLAWKKYSQRLPSWLEVENWFAQPAGIGLVCGQVSGGLEVIDFDDGALFEPWRGKVHEIVNRLPVVWTPSDGRHVLYRCRYQAGNSKLAVDPGREKQTLIETRGNGGYVVGVGSPANTHVTRNSYRQEFGPQLPVIPIITVDERNELLRAAVEFDRRDLTTTTPNSRLSVESPQLYQPRYASAAIAQFNPHLTWEQILAPWGWRSNDGKHWIRPGKQHGTSARVNTAKNGDSLLTVFSSNCGPLAPTKMHKSWSKYAAWTALNSAEFDSRQLHRRGGA